MNWKVTSKNNKTSKLPNYLYNNSLIDKFTQHLIKKGKKATAIKIIKTTLDFIKIQVNINPNIIFLKAVNNLQPEFKLKSMRMGGTTRIIPKKVLNNYSLAFKLLLKAAKKRSEKGIALQLANEIIAASQFQGNAIKEVQLIKQQVSANRAYINYKW
nr:ribosomal protein S7 [Microheliella maris]